MRRLVMVLLTLLVVAWVGNDSGPALAVPQHVSFQGELRRDGSVYHGDADFKFVIFGGDISLWSNDGTSVNLSEPETSVTVAVADGIFDVRLGDEPMVPLSPDVLSEVAAAWLRLWVDTGEGFEQLPDHPLSASPYSLLAVSAERAVGGFTAGGIIHSESGGFRFPDGSLQTTAAVGGGGSGGTLDQAYDHGGAGAGRTIIADAGAVEIGGSDGLTVAGKVGIGTSSPTEQLHIGSGIARFDGSLRLADPGASASNLQVDLTGGYGIYRDAVGAGGDNTRLWVDAPEAGEIVLGPRGGSAYLDNFRLRSNQISLETSSGGGSQFKLLQNGNIGIGTTTPLARLHVHGGNVLFDTNSGVGLLWVNAGDGTVGIGMSSASHKLSVNGPVRVDALEVFTPGDVAHVEIASNDPVFGAGSVSVKSSATVTGVRLSGRVPVSGSSRGGGVDVYDETGVNSFELRGNFSTTNRGCWIALKDEGQERVTFAAENGATGMGGLVDVKNDLGQTTIRLIGDMGDGHSRVITSVIEITGGADLAELFPVSDADRPSPGTVLVIDETRPGHLRTSDRSYDRRVAGVVSGAGGISAGLTMSQTELGRASDARVALSGRVYVLADASSAPIRPGDLLTTSDRPGHAMAAADLGRASGATLGKAMSGLEEGQGLVLALVNLQ